MADTVKVENRGGPSPEGVAMELLKMIINIEDKNVHGINSGGQKTDRTWLLDTYAECLWATSQRRTPPQR